MKNNGNQKQKTNHSEQILYSKWSVFFQVKRFFFSNSSVSCFQVKRFLFPSQAFIVSKSSDIFFTHAIKKWLSVQIIPQFWTVIHCKLKSKSVLVLPSLNPSLLFTFHLFPSPLYPAGFSFCFFPGFLDTFILLSSNNDNNNRQRNQLLILFNQIKIRLYLTFSNWFGTKSNSV